MNRNAKNRSVCRAHIALTFPLKIRLSCRMIAFCILFTLFALIIGYGVIFINVNPIYMEDDTPMPVFLKIFFTAVASIVEAGVLYMVISLWKRIFRSGAMTLTQAGIENTFVIFSVFAFWTILPVRLIPWNALQFDESDDPNCDISNDSGCDVDVKQLPPGSTGRITKWLMRIFGFQFQIGKISKEDLKYYRKMALSQACEK